ncbi:hypothetical protein GQ457_12G015180 [Hibiscus cannabinus]
MFDLAIKRTLEKTLAAQTLGFCADFPSLRELGFAIFASFGKEFPNFALVIIRIQSIRFKKKSSCDFSPGILCYALSLGSGKRRSSFSLLDDSIKRTWRSTCS